MYAGEEYGAAGATMANGNPVKMSGLSTEHAAAVIVIGSVVLLAAIRRGFLPTSLGRITGGLVK